MPEKPVRIRKPRRNIAKELADLQARVDRLKMYCELSIGILGTMAADQPTDHASGQIAALKGVLAMLEGGNG